MAGLTSLPAGWQTLLENAQGCRPYIEVFIDPDGDNIELSGESGLVAMSDIFSGIEIEPNYFDQLQLRDLQLSFADVNQMLTTISERVGALRVIQRVMDNDPNLNNPCTLRDGMGNFAVGDTVYFSDGENSESVVLTSAAANSIGWVGALVNSYAEGSLVMTLPLTGKVCEVKLRLSGNANAATIYKGIVKDSFAWDGQTAVLTLTNYLVRLLEIDLKLIAGSVNPTSYLDFNGAYKTSLTWSSGSTTTLSAITTYAKCGLGEWQLTIGAGSGVSYTFELIDPDGNEYTGSTAADFFTHTDATDSLISILAASWGGVIHTGDVLTFKTAVNLQLQSIVAMIYNLLIDYTDGVITDADIDVGGTGYDDGAELGYSFNKLYSITSGRLFSVTFDQPCKVIEAIMTLLPHELALLCQMLSGKLRIFSLNPSFEMDTLTPRIVGNPKLNRTEPYNDIKVWYKWDHTEDKYVGAFVTYPETDAENPAYKLSGKKKSAEIYCPLFVD